MVTVGVLIMLSIPTLFLPFNVKSPLSPDKNKSVVVVIAPSPDSVTLPVLFNVTVFASAASKPLNSMPPVALINVKLSRGENAPAVIFPVPSLRPMVIFEKPSTKLSAK